MKFGGRSQPQPHQIDACRRKVAHASVELAEAECFRVWQQRRQVCFPYRCAWCGRWHLTKRLHSRS